MTEIEKIKKHTKGEIPKGKYDILRVEDIDNPQEVLEVFKQSIITILENKHLDNKDKKWEKLLPQKIVNIVNQFDDDDYSNDDLIMPINLSIYSMRDLKEWEWYSSQIIGNRIEVYFEGIFRGGFTWFVHCQGIPLSKITIERDGVIYPMKVFKDVMSYKKFK